MRRELAAVVEGYADGMAVAQGAPHDICLDEALGSGPANWSESNRLHSEQGTHSSRVVEYARFVLIDLPLDRETRLGARIREKQFNRILGTGTAANGLAKLPA